MTELDLNFSVVEIRLCVKNRYGCQPFDNLSKWICFKPEVEEWMETNMKRKSGIKIKYWRKSLDSSETRQIFRPTTARFANDHDALLFKMRWL